MKNYIPGVSGIFESRIRLGVMSALFVNEGIRLKGLESLLEVTNDHLVAQMLPLEEIGFIRVHKQFVVKKAITTYSITKLGEQEFKDHVKVLEVMAIGIRG